MVITTEIPEGRPMIPDGHQQQYAEDDAEVELEVDGRRSNVGTIEAGGDGRRIRFVELMKRTNHIPPFPLPQVEF